MPVSTPTLYERRSLVNLNKLFGRLPIRRKLGIAFAVLALGPVALVAALATQVTVAHLYQIAQRALEHDLERRLVGALGGGGAHAISPLHLRQTRVFWPDLSNV